MEITFTLLKIISLFISIAFKIIELPFVGTIILEMKIGKFVLNNSLSLTIFFLVLNLFAVIGLLHVIKTMYREGWRILFHIEKIF